MEGDEFEGERTFAPLVILVIHVNIHVVGLMFSSSTFQKKFNLGKQMNGDVDPQALSNNVGKTSKLYISC